MSGQSATVAARRLGLHYLQRYFCFVYSGAWCVCHVLLSRARAVMYKLTIKQCPECIHGVEGPFCKACHPAFGMVCCSHCRYYYLICFRAYLKTAAVKETSFARWFADRPELKYLLSTLTLEVVV